jgi:hypothetical protein
MGNTFSPPEYKDPLARKADIAINAYIIGEAIWVLIWLGTIISLEATEQIGFDADSKFELQGTISSLHAVATAGIIMYWRGETHWYVYLSLVPVLGTDLCSLLHLLWQVPEASTVFWVLCMVVTCYGLVLDLYAIVAVIVMKEILKITFVLTKKRPPPSSAVPAAKRLKHIIN